MGDSRLIVRAGYGVYFDQAQVQIFMENAQYSSFPPLFGSIVGLENPPLSNPGSGTSFVSSFASPPLLYAVSDHFVAPRWQHWNIGVQRRLYSHGVADIGYVGAHGDHLLRYVDINKSQPDDVLALGGNPTLARPYLGLAQIIMRETTGFSRYHGVERQ